MVVTIDDIVGGVVGITREREAGKFFSDHKPELEPYMPSMPVMRAIKKAMTFVEEYRGPVLAMSKHGEGARILTRLGFVHGTGEYFLYPKGVLT